MSAPMRYLHLVGAVLLTGYLLFWVLIVRAIRSEKGRSGDRLIAALGGFRWPSPSGPPRAGLSTLGWVFFAGVALTGVGLLALSPGPGLGGVFEGPHGPLLALKLGLVAALGATMAVLARRPSGRAAAACGALALLVLAASALLGR